MVSLMVYEPRVIEDWLAKNGLPIYDHASAWDVDYDEIPLFMPVFYEAALLHPTRPPSPIECWSLYLAKYKTLANYPNLYGVRQRFMQIYMSFIRELHCYTLFKHVNYFDGVFNDLHLDVAHGFDFIVWKDKPRYLGIQTRIMFNGSEHSEKWKPIKKERHERNCDGGVSCSSPIPIKAIEEIDLPLEVKDAKCVGGYYLYTPQHIEKLKKIMYDINYWK